MPDSDGWLKVETTQEQKIFFCKFYILKNGELFSIIIAFFVIFQVENACYVTRKGKLWWKNVEDFMPPEFVDSFPKLDVFNTAIG